VTNAASEHSDGIVVAAVLAGDRDQFSQLVVRYHGGLLRFAQSRLGRREWAEDVVQETLLNAFKSLHTYDSQYSFRTWLWTILLNQCHRHFKKRGRNEAIYTSEPSVTEAATQQTPGRFRVTESPADRLMAAERSEQLNALLDQLPEPQADALRLRFFGGLKFREIALTMQCSLSTAKNRVRWGLNKMADQIGPNEETNRRSTAESCHESPDEL